MTKKKKNSCTFCYFHGLSRQCLKWHWDHKACNFIELSYIRNKQIKKDTLTCGQLWSNVASQNGSGGFENAYSWLPILILEMAERQIMHQLSNKWSKLTWLNTYIYARGKLKHWHIFLVLSQGGLGMVVHVIKNLRCFPFRLSHNDVTREEVVSLFFFSIFASSFVCRQSFGISWWTVIFYFS